MKQERRLSNTKVDVFNNPIWKSLILLAWPIIISNLLQTIYNLTDAFFLGKLGPQEFSAPTVSFPIIFVFISLASGFSHAGASMVAQYTGMKNKKAAEKAAAQTILTVGVVATGIMIFGYIFAGRFLSLMSVTPDIYNYALTYLRIIIISLPFTFLTELLGGIFRGWGNSYIALRFNFIAIIMNIILDPLLIFGLGLGVYGAAVATLISRGTMSIIFLTIIIKGKLGFRIHLKDFLPDFSFIKKVLTIGLPSSLGQSVTAFGFTVIIGVVSRFGAEVISGYGVGNRITSMIVMFAIGISLASSSMVAQFVGAGETKKASKTIKTAAAFTFFSVSFFSVLLFFFGHNVTRFFINDPKVIEIGGIFFSLISFSLPFFATMSVFLEALRGTGHTIQSTIVDLTRLWCVRVPLVLVLSNLYGFHGIFYAMIISNIAALIIALIFFNVGSWKKKTVHTLSEECI